MIFQHAMGPKTDSFFPRSRKRNHRMIHLAQVDVTEPNQFGWLLLKIPCSFPKYTRGGLCLSRALVMWNHGELQTGSSGLSPGFLLLVCLQKYTNRATEFYVIRNRCARPYGIKGIYACTGWSNTMIHRTRQDKIRCFFVSVQMTANQRSWGFT